MLIFCPSICCVWISENAKAVIDSANVVFCNPYEAHRFRTVLETLKSAAECSNCLITPCIPGDGKLTFPAPPVVPCTIVDPTCMQRPCPPPFPPPCCAIPFCPPNPSIQFQQPRCQGMPMGLNPCLGAPNRMEPDLCGQPQGIFHLHCQDMWNQQYPCHGQPTYNPQAIQGQRRNKQPDSNIGTASPSLGNTPGLWSGYATPQGQPPQSQYQQHQMYSRNDRESQPPSPDTYPQGGDRGQGVRFNSNVQYKQPSQQGWMGSNFCASAIPDEQMDDYDPYSLENCFGKILFCAPGCLVRLSSDMVSSGG